MTDEAPSNHEEPELQQVFLRYADSHEGFSQAAELMDEPNLAKAFEEIAERRKEVGSRIATMLKRRGEIPEVRGSVEGAAHRWWIRLRDAIDDDEMKAVFEECVRGEKVLARALEKALELDDLHTEQEKLLREALDEVRQAIEVFSTALS